MALIIQNLITRSVNQFPEKIAVSFEGKELNYRDLELRSDYVASCLIKKGVIHNNHVGICVSRSLEMLVAVLGVLKAGAGYVPIDPRYPKNRIQHMVEDSGAKLIVTDLSIDYGTFDNDIDTFVLDGSYPAEFDRLNVDVSSSNLAYTIYTSGSTGKPKGVQVTHDNVVNFLQSMQHTPGITKNDRLLAVTTLSFDIAVLELYLPLIVGATVEIASRELASDGSKLADRIDRGDITIMQATPATWRMLLQSGWKGGTGLKALVGGEALPKDILPKFLERVDQLWNMYGPTETTVWSTCFLIKNAEDPILIGKPIDNTTVYVVDENGHRAADGQPGELLIGGDGVTRGYYNRPELNQERFIADNFGNQSGARLYRTGDLVKMLADGNLQYINRLDNQIKLRGFRIELGEIEAVIAKHEAVSQCVVVLRNDSAGEPRLVAYVKNTGVRTTTAGELRAFAQRDLPEFMTPSVWVFIDEIPLTPNGKVDRKALPEPSTDRPELGQAYVPPRTPLEKYLAKIWKENLGIDKVGTKDRFFDLGGNSIKAIQFVDQLSNKIGEKISMPGFFGAPCIADFADLIEREHSNGVSKILGRAAVARSVQVNNAERVDDEPERKSGEVEDIAIVGMAARLPGAGSVEEFWHNLKNGVESRHQVTADDLIAAGLDPSMLNDPNYVPACMPLEDVDKFDAAFFGIHPREAQMMDPQHRLFLECSWTALEDAGYAPDACPGSVGVFAGIARNAYHLHNISANNELRNNAHDYSILLGNDKDFLATRVSYKLNLSGPSMSVLSACSGSGTALHQARLALLNGDCDMAIVGGGRVMSPHKIGYHYVDGNVLSADGRVHTFDADASGMVRGSGMVAIVLKRLSDAIDNNDNIKAVIKATAVNNDGSTKASFTAPSVPGQVSAIKRAMKDAGISPDSISYVEAHGTGTRLGDPIEIAALNEAWADRKKGNQYCPIGSSKTNIGHLDAGACVAGIIKSALCFQHKQIPPSLNFKKPNPLIDFANSPFYVNTKLSDWPTEVGQPRRAAVSSFGVGGTNVHVLLEEPPERSSSSESRPKQLLLLSAKRPEAIALQAAELAEKLKTNVELKLADIAYTLQVGRSNLVLRHPVVCASREDAIEKLEKLAEKGVKPKAAEEGVPVVFMFPGQGSQHVNMAKELFQQEAVYRVHFEHCSRALKPLLGLDLWDLVYPNEAADLDALSEQLKRTEIAQLALFTVEYSIAKVWLSWGVSPASMIGHSVGEFVAACLADVIELHDCLRILHARATLMGSMPPGDMMAVALSAEELKQHLIEGVSLAASNAPQICVVSGTSEVVTRFGEQLKEKEIQTFPLHTSHAFHSEMMEPILKPFIAAFDNIDLKSPTIPFISSLTGTWITDEQATSPEYWAKQLRNAVLFSKGIETILEEDNPLFLEVGPSVALTNSVRKHSNATRPLTVIATLSSAQKPEPALETTLHALGLLWAAGVVPKWSSFYASESRIRVSLPTYPFEKVRHWIEPPVGWAGAYSVDPEMAEKFAQSHNIESQEPRQKQTSAAPADHKGRVTERLRTMLFNVTGIEIDQSDDETSFLDLGFDSLLLTQISGNLTKEFGIALRFWELIEEYSSVSTLSEYMLDKVENEQSGQERVENAAIQSMSADQVLENRLPKQSLEGSDELVQIVERQALIIDAIAEKLRSLSNGYNPINGSSRKSNINWHVDMPPVPGAKLGRGENGEPAWYIEDPHKSGSLVRWLEN